jgi:hypothetical protein
VNKDSGEGEVFIHLAPESIIHISPESVIHIPRNNYSHAPEYALIFVDQPRSAPLGRKIPGLASSVDREGKTPKEPLPSRFPGWGAPLITGRPGDADGDSRPFEPTDRFRPSSFSDETGSGDAVGLHCCDNAPFGRQSVLEITGRRVRTPGWVPEHYTNPNGFWESRKRAGFSVPLTGRRSSEADFRCEWLQLSMIRQQPKNTPNARFSTAANTSASRSNAGVEFGQ